MYLLKTDYNKFAHGRYLNISIIRDVTLLNQVRFYLTYNILVKNKWIQC